MQPPKTALVLFSHGSVLAGAGEALDAHAARLREWGEWDLVQVGYLNYSEPHFSEAVENVVREGAREIVVVPYFLVPGWFVTHSLPEAVDFARAAHPEIAFRIAPPLGFDERLADALLNAAIAAQPPAAGRTALLVMVHGSPKPEANDEMYAVVTALKARQDAAALFPIVEVGFMECNEPTIRKAIASCMEQGAEAVVAVPYFLHTGAHVREDLPELLGDARRRHPKKQFAMADYLGLSPRLTDLLALRAKQAG